MPKKSLNYEDIAELELLYECTEKRKVAMSDGSRIGKILLTQCGPPTIVDGNPQPLSRYVLWGSSSETTRFFKRGRKYRFTNRIEPI